MPLVVINNSLYPFSLGPEEYSNIFMDVRGMHLYVMDEGHEYPFRPFDEGTDYGLEIWPIRATEERMRSIMENNKTRGKEFIPYNTLIDGKQFIDFSHRTDAILVEEIMKDKEINYRHCAPIVVEVPEGSDYKIKTVEKIKGNYYGKERIFIKGKELPIEQSIRSRLREGSRDSSIRNTKNEWISAAKLPGYGLSIKKNTPKKYNFER